MTMLGEDISLLSFGTSKSSYHKEKPEYLLEKYSPVALPEILLNGIFLSNKQTNFGNLKTENISPNDLFLTPNIPYLAFVPS